MRSSHEIQTSSFSYEGRLLLIHQAHEEKLTWFHELKPMKPYHKRLTTNFKYGNILVHWIGNWQNI